MPKAIEHPVFGRLIPDQWGEDLMLFREFPYLRQFFTDDPAKLTIKNVPQGNLVKKWQDQPPELAKICRDWGVIDALQGLGVYEVTVELDGAAEPSPEQAAAYRYFEEHEEAICKNVCDALLRYYGVVFRDDADWMVQHDCPPASTQEELAPLVDFDGFSITRSHSEGLSVLMFGWGPKWDQEHGLRMAVWRDQVIGIGLEDVYDIVEASEYMMWNASHMTDAEQAALKRFQTSAVIVDEEDDLDFDPDDDEE